MSAMDAAALPLFPLGTVLFPDGVLTLHIFEVRYLDLMKRSHKENEPFGIVFLEKGHEVRRAPAAGHTPAPPEQLAPIGTLAALERLVQLQPGLLQVWVRGGQRFQLKQATQLPHGLWSGQIEWLPADAPVGVPKELDSLRTRLALAAPAFAQDDALVLPPSTDPRWQDTGWLANRWAERLPLPAQERQRLMALDNPLWRLELIAEWLDQLERMGQPTRPAG
jgi:Lon protease-like protein